MSAADPTDLNSSGVPPFEAAPTDFGVAAPMAGLVVAVNVKVGQRVEVGDALCVTETMKCESLHVAPVAGWVTSISLVGTTVGADDELVRLSSVPPAAERRSVAPDELIELLCTPSELLPEAATGRFVEYDLADGALVPVDRPLGTHRSGVMVGVVSHRLNGHPDGLDRVLICGDPSRSLGAVAEAECRLVIGAIDLAAARGIPIEWVAVSSGARIAWDSGTENMDWCAAVARHIVQFTQGDLVAGRSGGAVNVIVAGVNVGAQSYWNALATMLWHTAGVLIMVAEHAMVLTGRRALALSGGGLHDAESEMGGYAEVMGPNGEAHHVAADLPAAYRLLLDHLALSERRADGALPRAETTDDPTRSICAEPYDGPGGFADLGEILDPAHNPTRKLAFAIRPLMAAMADHDAERLERWPDQAGGHPAVVWDTRLGGWPVSLIGIESQPMVDHAHPDRPLRASGTLFPQASRKIARALNAASGRRAAVVLANLAGFDGSAASMLGRQLEYGAEIARAVVNFRGPIVVVVIGRFHGGAYVVFSRRLNPSVSILAVEGTYVSVIGGDAAAGVVFARDVRLAVDADLAQEAPAPGVAALRRAELEAHHRGVIARRFDAIHNVDRAAEVGSVDDIVSPAALRPAVIARLDAGNGFVSG